MSCMHVMQTLWAIKVDRSGLHNITIWATDSYTHDKSVVVVVVGVRIATLYLGVSRNVIHLIELLTMTSMVLSTG